MQNRVGWLVLIGGIFLSNACSTETPSPMMDAGRDANVAANDMATGDPDTGVPLMDMAVPRIDMSMPRLDMGMPLMDMGMPRMDMGMPHTDMGMADTGTPPVDAGPPYDPIACAAWFSSVDATLPALAGLRATQRTALISAGGGLRRETGKYIATWVPTGWVDASSRVVVVALHGTDGYPEADWTDWHGYFEERGWGVLAVSYLDAGVYDSATATYERVIASIDDMNSACGADITIHLMGFSRGSAQTFPGSLLDRMADGPITGVIANAGAWPPAGPMPPELVAVDGVATSMTGVQMWGWCGTGDDTHGHPMCDEMTNALAWVRAHGGHAEDLYSSVGLGHGDFKTDAVAVNAALDWLETLTPRH
ncbi:MAG: hypothetical protein IPK60_08895 [Sandaracinaceae bacterium]|jgi:hypothetical protein|nr:hypothetical protein [Sandaracinaceae bacterium]